MNKKLFNRFCLTNQEIERILKIFDKEIKNAVRSVSKEENQDYEQIIRIEIFKTLSKNRKI